MYEKYIKRGIDMVLSLIGLICLSWLYLIMIVAIKLDSPGTVFFTQKRVGKGRNFFRIHKFRTMRADTPHDVPTHMLDNPEQYITKTGRFMRKYSIDELPQIWDIFVGNMSFVGPRPALWNQTDLIAEREKYGANDVRPGLTGWAQINGRDELEIDVKAKFDGDYVGKLKENGAAGFIMDCKCFFGTINSVLRHDGVVEGGTGKLQKADRQLNRKRVLFLANHFITLYSFRKELIQKLVSMGHEVYLSLPESDENSYFIRMGCKIIPTEIDRRGVNPIKDIKLIKAYKKIILDVAPDIIFSYTIKPNIYGALVSNRMKYKQICNITGTGAMFLERNFLSKIALILYKMSVRNCYKVYFQNTGDRDFFINNKLVRKNWDMLPGSGVNLEQFSLKPMPTDHTVRFLFIGRVMRVKGIDEYLFCAKSIKKEFPNTIFYIAGWNEEEEYRTIIQEYQDAGYVEYIGFQNNISECIEKCHCIILPSHGGEGVPNALLEAAATGRVCIASEVNGSIDVIDHCKTGFLFKKGDGESLARAVKEFIGLTQAQKEAMGLAGRRKVEQEFDRNIVIQKYCEEL